MRAFKSYMRKQFCVALCVYFGQILLCFCLAWPGRWEFVDLDNNMTTPDISTQLQITHIDLRFISGLVLGACIFGCLSNAKGRKPCFLISGAICFCAYSLLLHMNRILAVVHVAKFLAGLGSGIAYVGILVYLGEIASKNIRGLLLTTTNIFMYFQSYIDIAATTYLPSAVMPYFGLFASACFFVTVFLIPESPVFFTLKGSKENLKKSLKSLGREEELKAMLALKTEIQSCNKTQKDNWLDMFTIKSNIKALFLTLILNLLQTLSGLVGVLYFLPQIVYPNPHVSILVIGLITLTAGTIGAVFSIFLVELVGRRTLLMISTGSCGLSLGILSTHMFVSIWTSEHIAWSWVLLVIVINYFFSFGLGFRIIPETLMGEMFTFNVRSTGPAFVISSSTLVEYSIGVLALNILTETISNAQLSFLFIVYCLINVIAFIVTLFLVPETKGLSLIEINEALHKKEFIRCSTNTRSQSEL